MVHGRRTALHTPAHLLLHGAALDRKARHANGSSLKALPNGARNYGYFQWRKKTGIEYHSKDKEDQHYSRLDNAVTEGATRHTLSKANGAVHCLADQAELGKKARKLLYREVFTEYIPSCGREDTPFPAQCEF